MKKIPFWLSVVALASLVMGCMTYKTVKTEQLSSFEKDIKSEYKQIDDLQVEFSPVSIDFHYSMNVNSDIGEEEVKEIFYKTKGVILGSKFQKEVIEEKYFKEHTQERHPRMYIRFDLNGDNNDECVFQSGYQKADVLNENPIKRKEGYQNWTLWDYENDPIPAPDQESNP